MKLENMIVNYINGNIKDARKAAKRHSQFAIHKCLVNNFGYTEKQATLTTLHIKLGENWQEACDAR